MDFWVLGIIILFLIFILVLSRCSKNETSNFGKKSDFKLGEEAERDIDSILMRVAMQIGGKNFRDIMIEKNGITCQIDNMLLTKKALYVIESKDYSGWIFGSDSQDQWRQTFAHYKNRYTGETVSKFQFYNPIKQNQSHIKLLNEKFPHLKSIPIKNFIVFGEFATLKNIQVKTTDAHVMNIGYLKTTLIEADNQLNKEISPELHVDLINCILSANITDPTKRLEHNKRIQKKYNS